MKIRKATKKDLQELVEMYIQFLNYMGKFARFVKTKKDTINKQELKAALNNRLRDSNKKIFLVAEENQKLMGFVEAEIMHPRESKTDKKVIEIVDIYTKDKRKGIGKRLFIGVEKWSKLKKAMFIQWEFLYGNKAAEEFCVKNKFKHFKTKMLKKLK